MTLLIFLSHKTHALTCQATLISPLGEPLQIFQIKTGVKKCKRAESLCLKKMLSLKNFNEYDCDVKSSFYKPQNEDDRIVCQYQIKTKNGSLTGPIFASTGKRSCITALLKCQNTLYRHLVSGRLPLATCQYQSNHPYGKISKIFRCVAWERNPQGEVVHTYWDTIEGHPGFDLDGRACSNARALCDKMRKKGYRVDNSCELPPSS
jgi:hypothetical protein